MTVQRKPKASSEDAPTVEELREENARLRADLNDARTMLEAVSETTSEMYWRTDAEHRFTYMSPAVVDCVDEPMSDQLGQTRQQLADDDFGSLRWQRHQRDLEEHLAFRDFVYTRTHANGDTRYIRVSGKPCFDDDGRFTGHIGVATDITAQRTAEDKALSAEANLIAAVNALDTTLSLWDAEDRLIICNEQFRTLNAAVPWACQPGTTFEEHVRALVEHSLAGINQDPEDWVQMRLERHINPQGSFELSRNDGRTVLIDEAKLADGGTITMATDITEQKKIEFELRESEQRLRDFGTTAADWFWEMDENLRFSYVSIANQELTGLKAQDHIGKTRREMSFGGFDDDVLRDHEACLERREPFSDLQFFRDHPDGTRLHLSISGLPIFDATGTFCGYRGVGRDVTKLVTTQQNLLLEMERAEEASRAKSQFLAHMSHELRTPLNAILGFSEMIKQQIFGPVGNDSYVGYAEDIQQSGQYLLSLINDLLDISRIESGKLEVQDEVIDVEDAANRAFRLFDQKLETRSISVSIQVDADARYLCADDRAISQILFNVISNAEKFSRESGFIEFKAKKSADGIRLTLTDAGCGFDASDIDTALAPFGRIENPMTKTVPGTGLGLPIVKSLVELHGGDIVINSEIGKGTSVTLSFPESRTP